MPTFVLTYTFRSFQEDCAPIDNAIRYQRFERRETTREFAVVSAFTTSAKAKEGAERLAGKIQQANNNCTTHKIGDDASGMLWYVVIDGKRTERWELRIWKLGEVDTVG